VAHSTSREYFHWTTAKQLRNKKQKYCTYKNMAPRGTQLLLSQSFDVVRSVASHLETTTMLFCAIYRAIAHKAAQVQETNKAERV
jgi:hypothetical protein